jgi:PAS domain S-box-containing protein
VTDQVIARKKIEESEEKYRSLFEAMDQGFCIIELLYENGKPVDYRYLEINSVFEKQTGLPNAVGKTMRELVPGIEAHWMEIYGTVATTGTPVRFIEESKALNRWFEVYAYKTGGPESRNVGVFFSDITHRKQSEERERQSKERFSLVAKATQDAIWDWNLATNEIWWNEGFRTLFGYSEEEIEPDISSWYNRVHPDDKERVLSGIHGVIDNGSKQWADEYRFRRKDDSYAIVLDRGYALHDNEGRPCRMLGSMQDITARKQAEEAIKESEGRFRRIANSLPLVVWTAAPDGALTYISNQWEALYGNKIKDSLGNGWASFVHPDDVANAAATWSRSLQTGTDYETEFRIKTKSGDYRWCLVRAVPVMDSHGQISSWYGSNTDIDEQKQAEALLEQRVRERTRELENINNELKRTNANLEEFAYAASHDMKEPIRKIHFFSERLKGLLDGKMEEEEKRLFERMQHASKRMGLLVDDLLAYSQTIRGAAEQETVDLNPIVQHVLEDLELEVQQKNAVVTTDPLPFVKGNKRQMQQLFQNLISNALKYNRPGIAPEVSISYTTEKGTEARLQPAEDRRYHRITFRDNGIGFEQADAERIFNVFTRLHGNKEYRGTGVGLSIVRKVVENHNGIIWAESEPGNGAAFFVLLPVD